MSGRTFTNTGTVASGGHWTIPEDLNVNQRKWWNDRLGEKEPLKGDFTFFQCQNLSGENYEIRLNNNRTTTRFLPSGNTGEDDNVFFEGLTFVNKSAGTTQASEIYILVDRPKHSIKELTEKIDRLLVKLGVD